MVYMNRCQQDGRRWAINDEKLFQKPGWFWQRQVDWEKGCLINLVHISNLELVLDIGMKDSLSFTKFVVTCKWWFFFMSLREGNALFDSYVYKL